jgi:hypothetical protein
MSGPLTTIRAKWQFLRSASAIDFHNTDHGTSPVTIDGTIRNPFVDPLNRLAAYMRRQVTQVNIAAAAAVEMGPHSTGIPVAAGHGFLAGDKVTIASSTGGTYDGNFTLLGVDPTHVHIPVAYTAKTFDAGTLIGSRAIESIKTYLWPSLNGLEVRVRFDANDHTGTFHIFGRREGDLAVKLIASVDVSAGTQNAGDGTFFASDYTVTSYWSKGILRPDAESGTGMSSIYFDTMGWGEFWLCPTVISHGTMYFDYSGL